MRFQTMRLPGEGDPFLFIVDEAPEPQAVDAPQWRELKRHIGARGIVVCPEHVDIGDFEHDFSHAEND